MSLLKKTIYVLILPLVISGLVFASREGTSKKLSSKSINGKKVALKKWEDSPDGIRFKKWESSPTGKKVDAAIAKIRKPVKDYTRMKGVITSLTLPQGSRLGYGLMVRINEEDYILSFGVLKPDDFQELRSLKVNDKIILKSRNISLAPKYSYPILSGEYVELNGKIIYKRIPRKGGC